MYAITPWTKKQAKKFGYNVKPSTRTGKKIDVYKDGTYLDSVGAMGYSDYGTYLIDKGKDYADERRRLYRARHTGTTQGEVLARNLLW
jgi:hypothetical protein